MTKLTIVKALLMNTLEADSSTLCHLHKTLLELPYKPCIYRFLLADIPISGPLTHIEIISLFVLVASYMSLALLGGE